VALSLESLKKLFADNFACRSPLAMSRAPGRVNLIGEHTDYNGGFVLPIALDKFIFILGAKNNLDRVRLYSADFKERAEFSLARREPNPGIPWVNYPQGVVDVLLKEGFPLGGFDAVVAGDVPIGAGLSSSAAFEVASASFLNHIFNLGIKPERLALLAQKAENDFVGVRCGIMDQFVSLFARKGFAILLDCDDLSYRYVPLEGSRAQVVIADTGVRHELAATEYNRRRDECTAAVRILAQEKPRLRNLRGVSFEDFGRLEKFLPQPIRRRARHVITENRRTIEAAGALEKGDLQGFGLLMNESHESLRSDYEVSCPELDRMVEIARTLPGCLGSRMTGGGFGGCTVSLVRTEAIPSFCTALESRYTETTNLPARVYASQPSDGAVVKWL